MPITSGLCDVAVLHSHLLAGSEIKLEDLPGRVSSSNPGDGDFIRLYVGTPLAEIERLWALMPSQTRRTLEQQHCQQYQRDNFETPFFLIEAANKRKQSHYLLSNLTMGTIISSRDMPPCWKVFL